MKHTFRHTRRKGALGEPRVVIILQHIAGREVPGESPEKLDHAI